MGTFALELAEFGLEPGDQGLGNFVLEGKNVGQVAVVALGPYVVAGGGVDQLGGNANTLAAFTDTAFDNVTNAEIVADVMDVRRLSFV